jgi:hypothetical protein
MTPIEMAEQGWHLVPWANRKASIRHPLIKGFLEEGAVPSVETVTAWVKQWPAADWAVVPRNHMVLDVEMKGGLDGKAELVALEEQYGELPEGPVTITYSKGLHIWLRLPDDCQLKGGVRISKGIEIKCRNGTAHVPPSMGYEYRRPLGAPNDVPLAPQWLLDLWAEAKPTKVTFSSQEKFAPGERHAALCSAAAKFRNMGLGERAIFYALQGVREERCDDPASVPDEELESIAKSYAEKSADSYDLRVEQKEPTALSVEAFFKRKVAPVQERAAPVEEGLPVMNSALLRPTALIAEWVDWVLANADRPQPELSLLAACVGLGGMVGRNLTWHHAHANIYGLGLASSGSGKDAPLHSIGKLYKAAGFEDLLGASRLGSDAGLLTAINTKPNIVWALDEISLLLENMGKPNCPGYITGIVQYLLELYSCNAHSGIELKGVPPTPLPNPYPCILSFAQPATFARVFSEKMADNGLMGRFVPFLGEDLPAKNYHAKRDPPPDTLVAAVKSARTARPTQFDKLIAAKGIVEITCDAATEAHYLKRSKELEARMQELKNTDRMRATLLARTMEKAQKFSLIHAWSLDPADPVMTIESIDWGVAVVQYSNECMHHITARRVVNPQEEMVEYLYDCVCKHGSVGISQGKLTGIARRLDRMRRETILKDLIDSGRVIAHKQKNLKGPSTIAYIADKFVRRIESE